MASTSSATAANRTIDQSQLRRRELEAPVAPPRRPVVEEAKQKRTDPHERVDYRGHKKAKESTVSPGAEAERQTVAEEHHRTYARRNDPGLASMFGTPAQEIQAPTLRPASDFQVAGLSEATPVATYQHPKLGEVQAIDLQELHKTNPKLAEAALKKMHLGYEKQFPDPDEQMELKEFKDLLFGAEADPSWNIVLLKQDDTVIGAAHVNVPEAKDGEAAPQPFLEYAYRMPIAELQDVRGLGGTISQMSEDHMQRVDERAQTSWLEVNDPRNPQGIDSMDGFKREEFWGAQGYAKLDALYVQHPLSDDKGEVPLQLGVKAIGEHPHDGLQKETGIMFKGGKPVGIKPDAAAAAVHDYFTTWTEPASDSVHFQRTKADLEARAAANGGYVPLIGFTQARTGQVE